MQEAADTPQVEQSIQRALADESATGLCVSGFHTRDPPPSLTVTDARRIIRCIRENPRFHTLSFHACLLLDAAVLDIFRDGLPLCTSVTKVILSYTRLGNKGLEILLPAFRNTSVTSLEICYNQIQGQRGVEIIRDLVVGNNTLLALDLNGAEGGRLVGLWLQLFRQLKILNLAYNNLGPLGAHALAPGLATAARHLEVLDLSGCGFGNDGVANLIPDGQVNRTLTSLKFGWNNNIHVHGLVGGENLVALVSRCTNLDRIDVDEHALSRALSPDQRRRVDLLLDRKRLCTRASALAGSTFSVLFQFVEEEAHRHEHGLSAIFVILQNDGDDYFCNAANDRAI